MHKQIDLNKWSRFLFYFWLYTLLVILWGAWVRISHSGDGCGDHWPLCDGAFIPEFKQTKTWVEYGHRLMSGAYGLVVFYLFFKIRSAAVSPIIKKLNWALLILMISEALLGAVLVKGQLVTANDSYQRMFVMIFHQMNSFLLTGVTYMYYVTLRNNTHLSFGRFQKVMLLLFLLLPITGAIAALSTTLFPSMSLWQGILDDLSGQAHPFVRLRVLHPLLAILISGGFITWLFMKNQSRLAIEFLIAVLIGLITLLTLSPAFLKLTHLLIAHVLWARVLATFNKSKY